MLFRGVKKGGQTASNTKKCGAGLAGSAERLPVGRGYAAAFFVGFDAGLGVAFFAALAFSFAANSCLTLGATCKAVRMIVRETRLVAHCFTGPVVPSAVLYEAMR